MQVDASILNGVTGHYSAKVEKGLPCVRACVRACVGWATDDNKWGPPMPQSGRRTGTSGGGSHLLVRFPSRGRKEIVSCFRVIRAIPGGLNPVASGLGESVLGAKTIGGCDPLRSIL